MNKKILATICLVAMLGSLTLVYAAVSWTQSGNWILGQPGLAVTTPVDQVSDFGTVTEASVITRTYTVTNTGNTPITVTGTLTASGCTAVLSPTSAALNQGQAAVFTATFSTFTTSGSYTINFAAT